MASQSERAVLAGGCFWGMQGAAWLREELDLIEAEGKLDSADMPMLITRLAAKHPVLVHYITGHWLDVDTLEDLSNARNFT
jgi:phosphoenolpyruvate phosphomutase